MALEWPHQAGQTLKVSGFSGQSKGHYCLNSNVTLIACLPLCQVSSRCEHKLPNNNTATIRASLQPNGSNIADHFRLFKKHCLCAFPNNDKYNFRL